MKTRATIILLVTCLAAWANNQQTLFSGNMKTHWVWGTGTSLYSVKDHFGSNLFINGGISAENGAEAGVRASANLTHPHLNYGTIGVYGKYTYMPHYLISPSVSLTAGTGSAKGYTHKKTSLFDNYMNFGGNNFYFIEPAVGTGLNLTRALKANFMVSYRVVTGMEKTTFNQSDWRTKEGTTHTYRNSDLNSVGVTLQLQFDRSNRRSVNRKSRT